MTWKPKQLTRKQMEERRRTGGHLLQAGKQSQAEIARRLGVSRATVSDWAKQVAAGGLRALRRHSASGRPSRLTAAQKKRLVQILKRGALAAGFPTERWTMGRVQQIIRREYDVVYHVHYMNRLLERLGWSLQQPLPSAQEQEEELIRAWIQRDWPRIKKARRRGVNIVFFDEFGSSFLERFRRTWAPRGQRPILRRVTGDRRVLTTAVGLTLSGKIYKRHFEGAMDSQDVISVLEHLRHFMPEGFILICDHLRIHTSEETIRYFWDHPEIMVEPLPKYAPELNPEEYCHGNVKAGLANATPANKKAMRRDLDRGFARLRRRPDLLLAFVHQAGLPVRQLWLT